jgi:hypothetical protein
MSIHVGGLSFYDLREQAEHVQKAHNCRIHVEMHLPVRAQFNFAWHVRVVARWFTSTGERVKERGEGGQWPHIDAKTLAGLIMLLLVRLETAIEEEERSEVATAKAQGRLF